VVEHAPRVDTVEARIFERQGLCVRDAHIAAQSLELESPANELDGMLGEIDPCERRAAAPEAHEVGSEPDSDLEYSLSSGTCKISERRNERLELVAAALDLIEKLACPFRRGGVSEPARGTVPEGANTLFESFAARRRFCCDVQVL
jgi:hypothetical protein